MGRVGRNVMLTYIIISYYVIILLKPLAVALYGSSNRSLYIGPGEPGESGSGTYQNKIFNILQSRDRF